MRFSYCFFFLFSLPKLLSLHHFDSLLISCACPVQRILYQLCIQNCYSYSVPVRSCLLLYQLCIHHSRFALNISRPSGQTNHYTTFYINSRSPSLDFAVDSSTMKICVHDPVGSLLYMNPPCCCKLSDFITTTSSNNDDAVVGVSRILKQAVNLQKESRHLIEGHERRTTPFKLPPCCFATTRNCATIRHAKKCIC